MFICFSGGPGGGKSYEVVKRIGDNLRKGRKVYCNVEGFDKHEIQEAHKVLFGLSDFDYDVQMHFLAEDQIKHFWDFCEPGSLIVVDEIHLWFSNRDWASPENKKFTDWASKHRHYGYDVICLTQSVEKLDKHIRSLIEWTYYFRKINYFGRLVGNSYTCDVYIGDDERGKPFKRLSRRYDKRIFQCYDSYVSKDIKEQGIGTHVNVLLHPIFFLIPVALAVTFYMLFWRSSAGSGDLFGLKRVQARQVAAQQAIVEDGKKKSIVSPAKFDPVVVSPRVPVLPASVVSSYHETIEPVQSCIQTGRIKIEDEEIVMEKCGNTFRKRINGVVVYEKENRRGDGTTNGSSGLFSSRRSGGLGGPITIPMPHVPEIVRQSNGLIPKRVPSFSVPAVSVPSEGSEPAQSAEAVIGVQ